VQSNLNKTDDALALLNQDGITLLDTLDEHHSLKKGLASTKSRLRIVKYAEIIEQYSVFISLSFFTIVVSYIILKRTRILSLIYFALKTYFHFSSKYGWFSKESFNATCSILENVTFLNLSSSNISIINESIKFNITTTMNEIAASAGDMIINSSADEL
jgi:hypothetical protein